MKNVNDISKSDFIDETDMRILAVLQEDASLSNQELAQRSHTSAPTCLRRVRRMRQAGLIARQIAILDPQKMAQAIGHGITAIVEVSLDRQDADSLDRFAQAAGRHAAVQQCYRVSPGPDFVLVLHCANMPHYAQLSLSLFTADANVRNVKTFFSIARSKFGAALALTNRTEPQTE